jgi:hypothetical protein
MRKRPGTSIDPPPVFGIAGGIVVTVGLVVVVLGAPGAPGEALVVGGAAVVVTAATVVGDARVGPTVVGATVVGAAVVGATVVEVAG